MSLSRISHVVRQLGYSGSPLSLDEFLNAQEIIESLRKKQDMPQRILYPPVTFSCMYCQKKYTRPAFDVRKWLASGVKRNYCSNKCFLSAKKTLHKKKCIDCNTLLPLEKKTGKFCQACLAIHRARSRGGKYPSRKVICPMCGNGFVSVYRRKGGKYAEFCSRECANRAHSRRMAGKGNPMWKHGATPLRQQPHSARAFRHARLEVLKRDGNACVVCQKNNIRLEVHHLDNYPMNNASLNLVTLCCKHHVYSHKMIRTGGLQAEKWLLKLKKLAMKPLPMTLR